MSERKVPEVVEKVIQIISSGASPEQVSRFYQDGTVFGPAIDGIELPINMSGLDVQMLGSKKFSYPAGVVYFQEMTLDGEYVLIVLDADSDSSPQVSLIAVFDEDGAMEKIMSQKGPPDFLPPKGPVQDRIWIKSSSLLH